MSWKIIGQFFCSKNKHLGINKNYFIDINDEINDEIPKQNEMKVVTNAKHLR
jgi:hypothetical protein